VKLAQLRPLAEVSGVRLVSLQKGAGSEQLAEHGATWGIADLGGQVSADFRDTAAVLANLDLVVTVDTAVAHLAGALAVPVWILLPLAADWRWLREREDSVWYPSARLFRQRRWGDWDGVLERVAEALRSRILWQLAIRLFSLRETANGKERETAKPYDPFYGAGCSCSIVHWCLRRPWSSARMAV
jgi:hypothetical protein